MQKELEQLSETMGVSICLSLNHLSGWHYGPTCGSACNVIKILSSDLAGGICGARSDAHFSRFSLKGRWQDEMVGLILEDGENLYLRFIEEFDLIKRRRN